MSYSDEQVKKILELAPECDKKCTWCHSTTDWVCHDFTETDHGTTIYEYECTNHNVFNEPCGKAATIEIEDTNPAFDTERV